MVHNIDPSIKTTTDKSQLVHWLYYFPDNILFIMAQFMHNYDM